MLSPMLRLAFALLMLGPLAAASPTPVLFPASLAPAAPQDQAAIAAALNSRLSIGFATEDRSFRLDSFAETAKAIAATLDYEFWSNGDVEASASDTTRPSFVAMEQWDAEAQALASKLGIEAVLVVKSASGKKGKATKKRYVKTTELYSGAAGTPVTYVGLTYKLKLEVHRRVEVADATNWEVVSSWRVQEDEREAPRSINLAAAVDGKITLTLGDVIKAKSTAAIAEISRAAAFETIERVSDGISAAYGILSEEQRTEFWTRAATAQSVSLAMPIEKLLDLAFDEWDEGDRESPREKLAKKKEPKPEGPLTLAMIMRDVIDHRNGTAYLFGPPQLRAAQRFVHAWSNDCAATGEPTYGPPGEIRKLYADATELEVGSHERAVALAYGQIDVSRAAAVPKLYPASRLSPAAILLSEECSLEGLFENAPAPRLLHAHLFQYTDQQAKEERKRKRFKSFDGAQLLVYQDGDYVVPSKVPRSKLTNADVYRMLNESFRPRWPHESE